MKFHDLAIGQRFELENELYLKTSPVLASKVEGGTSRFVARYVPVKPTDEEKPRARAESVRLLQPEEVLAAFEIFHTNCRQALEQLEGELPASRVEALQHLLEQGRQGFVAVMTGK